MVIARPRRGLPAGELGAAGLARRPARRRGGAGLSCGGQDIRLYRERPGARRPRRCGAEFWDDLASMLQTDR